MKNPVAVMANIIKTRLKSEFGSDFAEIDTDDNLWEDFIQNLMEEFGFDYKEVEGSTGYIYVNKTKRLVIKLPHVCGSKRSTVGDKKSRTIPTKIIEVGPKEKQIYVQPLADVRKASSKRAWKILTHYFGTDNDGCNDYGTEPSDFHDANVAMWKGRAWRIDW